MVKHIDQYIKSNTQLLLVYFLPLIFLFVVNLIIILLNFDSLYVSAVSFMYVLFFCLANTILILRIDQSSFFDSKIILPLVLLILLIPIIFTLIASILGILFQGINFNETELAVYYDIYIGYCLYTLLLLIVKIVFDYIKNEKSTTLAILISIPVTIIAISFFFYGYDFFQFITEFNLQFFYDPFN